MNEKIQSALDRDDSVISKIDPATLEQVKKALIQLQEAGLRVLLVPEAVVVRAGRVQMTAEGEDRPIPAQRTKVFLDGHEITRMLSFAQVTAEVGALITFEIKLGGVA